MAQNKGVVIRAQGPRSNFEIGGGTISDSILEGAQDTFSY